MNGLFGTPLIKTLRDYGLEVAAIDNLKRYPIRVFNSNLLRILNALVNKLSKLTLKIHPKFVKNEFLVIRILDGDETVMTFKQSIRAEGTDCLGNAYFTYLNPHFVFKFREENYV